MATRQVIVSDLSGKQVQDTREIARIHVLSHPTVDFPVSLDAQVLEVQSLLGKNQELVTLEVVLPDEQPIQVVIPIKDFDRLFSVPVVLSQAERYYPKGSTEPKRRGRPPRTSPSEPPASKPTGSGMSKETLAQVREWAAANGHTVAPRGRIAAPVIAAWEAAHES